MSRSPWLLAAALWPVALLNYLDRQIIFSLFPLLRLELGLSGVELGLLSTSFLWVYGLFSPLAGYAAERFGRRRVIVAGLLTWSLVTWATGRARSLAELFAARALMGLSEACYLPAALAFLNEHHPDRTRSLATGLHTSGVYAGMALGGAVGGWVGERYGWRPAFTVLGFIGVAYVPILLVGLRNTPDRRAGAAAAPPRLLASLCELAGIRGFLPLAGAFVATSIANWIVYTWLPLYIYERFHMGLAAAAVTATLYLQIGSGIGVFAGGWLADRWCARNRRGRLFTQAAGLAAAAPFLFVLGGTGSLALLTVALLVFGLGKGLYESNAMPVLCQIARTDLRATGYGVFNAAGCIAGGLAAPAAGALKSTLGLGACLRAAGVTLLLGTALLLVVRPEPAHRPEENLHD
jgi:MFS family permease